MSSRFTLDDLRHLNSGAVGITDVACPICGPKAKSPHNRTRKVLRIWDEGEDFATYCCQRCGVSGYATKEESGSAAVKKQPRPSAPASTAPKPDNSDLARNLWMYSAKAIGTLAETYLRSRNCWIASDNIRFLPARGQHTASMIARFGDGPSITGVHLTKLAPDGNSKAGTEKDKIMLGPSKGQPIIVHEHEGSELIISEGIEDAASWALATGWSSWAAGSAGRIPHVMALAKGFERVYVSLDYDDAGLKAIAAANMLRNDLIKIKFDPIFNSTDANKIIMVHGPGALVQTLNYSRLAYDRSVGRISRQQFHRERDRCCR